VIDGLTFDAAEHRYYFNGEPVPNVTRVLEPMVDYDRVPFRILEHAAQRGNAVHLATEFYDDGDLDEQSLDPEIVPYVQAWRTFRRESGFIVERSEVRVWSERHRFAGTVDAIGTMRGRRIMVEKKTTAQLHPATAIQVSAYCRAYNSAVAPAERVRECYSVWLRRDGTYRFKFYDPLEHWAMFLAMLNPNDPQSPATREAWERKWL
jgi:hypothetical protein